MSGRQQRVMVQPIVRSLLSLRAGEWLIVCSFALECHLQELATGTQATMNVTGHPSDRFCDSQRTKVVIWLYDNIEMRIEGRIIVRIPHPIWTHLALNFLFIGRRCLTGDP